MKTKTVHFLFFGLSRNHFKITLKKWIMIHFYKRDMLYALDSH